MKIAGGWSAWQSLSRQLRDVNLSTTSFHVFKEPFRFFFIYSLWPFIVSPSLDYLILHLRDRKP